MLNYGVGLLSLLTFLTFSNTANARDLPVQVRLSAGMTGVSPTNANEGLTTQGLKKLENVTQLGLEITYPIASYLDVGARYTKRLGDSEENPADPNTDYSAKLDQDSVMLIARAPFLKSDAFRMDAFVGIGGSNTSLKIKSAGQDGELTSKADEGWFDSPYAAAGISASVGYKMFYLVFEGGYESNKVSSFKRSGTVSSSIDTLDLSGSYFTISLMFDGIQGSVK
jgi:hypothetical protein